MTKYEIQRIKDMIDDYAHNYQYGQGYDSIVETVEDMRNSLHVAIDGVFAEEVTEGDWYARMNGLAIPDNVIDLNELAIRCIRNAYLDAYGPQDPNITGNDIDWHIVEIIREAARPDDETYLLKREIHNLKRHIEDYCAPQQDHEFKNFHRMLCERFEYSHDHIDWKRDQVSLMEHIANKVARQVQTAAFPELDTSKKVEQQGMFRKFDVCRADGSSQPGGKHHGCRYYVLDLTHDKHAPDAMRAYASSCKTTHPELAKDIEAEFLAATCSADAKDAIRDIAHVIAYLDRSGAPVEIMNRMSDIRAAAEIGNGTK